jgi:hypothetical protein
MCCIDFTEPFVVHRVYGLCCLSVWATSFEHVGVEIFIFFAKAWVGKGKYNYFLLIKVSDQPVPPYVINE